MSSELARRVGFAVVAAPVAILLLWLGGLPLALLLAVVSALGAWELFRIARAGGVDPLDGVGIPLAAALPLWAHFETQGVFGALRMRGAALPPAVAIGAVALLLVPALAIWARGVAGKPLAASAVTVFGALYTGGMLSFGYLLRYQDYAVGRAAGTAVVAFPMILTWASDIGAYFVGRALGRRKLIPAVSPGKTVAGAVGALVVTALVSWAYVRWALVPWAQLSLRPVDVVVFGLVVSVAAQLGDLVESLLKRSTGIKDSGGIVPGHGGMLDRIDALIFVAPIVYLYSSYSGLIH